MSYMVPDSMKSAPTITERDITAKQWTQEKLVVVGRKTAVATAYGAAVAATGVAAFSKGFFSGLKEGWNKK